MAQVVVFGAGGYSGLELVRWLAWHPAAVVVGASSEKLEGRPVADLVPAHTGPLRFTSHVETLARTTGGQIAFLATPAETAAQLAPTLLERGLRVIDLSGAHRLAADQYSDWYGFAHPFPESLREAVYGLPELFPPSEVARARLIANPGCYATAACLAAAPLVKAGLTAPGAPLIIDGKSGTTGAGRTLREDLLFSEVADDVRPYRVGRHQHTPEMERVLSRVAGARVQVAFTAHIVPMRRGLACAVYAAARPGLTPGEVRDAFESLYGGAALVRVRSDAPPETKRTLGLAHAEVSAHLDERTGVVSAFGAIDNLVKGAAGQAIQNMNALLGLSPQAGLSPEPKRSPEAVHARTS